MSGSSRFIGLMSGTSLDGVDGVIVDFSRGRPRFEGHHYTAFNASLRHDLLALCEPSDNEIDRMGNAAVALTRVYAQCVRELLQKSHLTPGDICAVGCHGQTIRHRPQWGWTLQLNNPAMLAELCGCDVIADFRSRDMAAGGEGAPLVPAFHRDIFTGTVPRTIVNIGGISNLTVLPGLHSADTVFGFDCGPGNMLLDCWCQKILHTPFDKDGEWASTGQIDFRLLEKLQSNPFFDKKPPKSTGREDFNLNWLVGHLSTELPNDVAATLTELTARTIADAIERFAPATQEIFLCGGGALNPLLKSRIQHCVTQKRAVMTTSTLGVDPMHVEAMAFAWLAWRFTQRQPGNLSSVTNACGPRLLGALYPF